MTENDIYTNARMNMDAAIADYIKAAQLIGINNQAIASDVCDSPCDASNRQIIIADATLSE